MIVLQESLHLQEYLDKTNSSFSNSKKSSEALQAVNGELYISVAN